MKNTNTKRITKLWSALLTVAMVFSLSVNTFAAWSSNGGGSAQTQNVSAGTYLDEIWLDSKQCINYYSNWQWVRNIAGQDHTLYLNGQVVMNNLYNTTYWCYDIYGNAFIIDTNQRLNLIKAGTTTVLTEDSVYGCTGFQRDNNKFGYLLYTNYGTYSLNDLLSGNTTNYNNTNYNNNTYNYSNATLTQNGNEYVYTYNGSTYRYELVMNTFYYNGQVINSNTQEIAFAEGYVLFVVKNNNTLAQVYRMLIGSTNKQLIGTGFKYFIYGNNSWVTYVQIGDKQVPVNTSSYSNDYNYNYNYDDYYYDDYYTSKVKKSGSTYTYYVSSSKYHKYSMSGSTLYYKGSNSSSKSVSIATSVDEITFTDGYIVYSQTNGDVYALPIGNTSNNSKIKIGTKFSYFDEEDDYWSYGYYNTSRKLISFDEKLDIDTYSNRNNRYYDYDDYDFYVEKSGSTYSYYPSSSSRYYKYQLSGSTLYYKGTNSSSKSVSIATSVDEIVFTEDYIVYALTTGKVYKIEIGETSSSYKEYIGDRFDYFDEEDDYVAYGYYNTSGKYIDF